MGMLWEGVRIKKYVVKKRDTLYQHDREGMDSIKAGIYIIQLTSSQRYIPQNKDYRGWSMRKEGRNR